MALTQLTDDRAAEHVAQWTRLPHPLEAAVLQEVNEPDPSVLRASDYLHRHLPGVDGPTRPIWVLARCERTGEGERERLSSWCWYATRQAAETARRTCSADRTVLHEIHVPRSLRCDGVADYLSRHYRARSGNPQDGLDR